MARIKKETSQRPQEELPKAEKRHNLTAVEYQVKVRKRAFEIYQDRLQDSRQGDDISDWFEAEEEFRFSNGKG